MAVDGDQQKLPDVRFLARLDPPLVMPYPIAVQVLASVGLQAPPMMAVPPQYAAALLLDPHAADANHANAQPTVFTSSSRQTVLSPKHGRDEFVTHAYTLESAKPDFSFSLTEVPFSHPRQLVELLPTLRQWASIGTLLRQTFAAAKSQSTSSPSPTPSTPEDSNFLGDLLSSPPEPQSQPQNHRPGDIPVSLALTTAPVPTLGLLFPRDSVNASVDVQILTNAELAVAAHDGFGEGANGAVVDTARTLARVLDVAGDMGVWVEWMRGWKR